MLTLDVYPAPAPGVLGRVVDAEAVLVLPERGEVKVLNEVGARIWELADGTRPVREIAKIICEEFAVDVDIAEADTLEFLEDLHGKEAISLANRPKSA
jgi:hypothetical protein